MLSKKAKLGEWVAKEESVSASKGDIGESPGPSGFELPGIFDTPPHRTLEIPNHFSILSLMEKLKSRKRIDKGLTQVME